MNEVECPYCGSTDTIDCGDIGDGEHHFECDDCRCGFPKEQDGDRNVENSQEELCDMLRYTNAENRSHRNVQTTRSLGQRWSGG